MFSARVLFVVLLICASAYAYQTFHFAKGGGVLPAKVKSGESFSVTCEGILSTGYHWFLGAQAFDNSVVNNTDSGKQEPPPDNWWFNFTAVGKPPATTVITICNQRPWVRDPPCEHYGNLTVAIIP